MAMPSYKLTMEFKSESPNHFDNELTLNERTGNQSELRCSVLRPLIGHRSVHCSFITRYVCSLRLRV